MHSTPTTINTEIDFDSVSVQRMILFFYLYIYIYYFCLFVDSMRFGIIQKSDRIENNSQ